MPDKTLESASSSGRSPVSPWSCFNCRRRKLRCDRHQPCSHCNKGHIECSFPVSGRLPTRQHDSATARSSKKKEAELRGRLRRLEAIVDGLGADFDGSTPQSSDAATSRTEKIQPKGVSNSSGMSSEQQNPGVVDDHDDGQSEQLAEDFGRLVVGKDGTFYVRSRLWAVLFDEVNKIRQLFQEELSRSEMDQGEILRSPAKKAPFVLENDSGNRTYSQPLPSQVPFIWQTFIENVDPFMKILHIPTMSKIVRESKGKFNSLPSGEEALMFAISLAAISSLTPTEVADNFAVPKEQLVTQLTCGVEKSLLRAGFLSTTDLSVVQAFVIYLEFAGYTYGSRTMWIMAGLLVRTAISMGLHRDGSNFQHISLFEAEMRRRLWWHICFLDGRICDGEASESSISEASFDTLEPTNTNDAELKVDMVDVPAAGETYTEMAICLLRCELWRLSCRINPSISTPQTVEERLEILEKSKNTIQKRYMAQLGVDEQTRTFVGTVVCLALTRCELVIRHMDILHRTSSISNEGQSRKYFILSVTSFEQTQALKLHPSTQKWAWTFSRCIPWHSIGIILTQLCVLPWGPTCEKAWTLVKQTVNNITETLIKKTPQHPIQTLMSTVHKHREEEIGRLRARPDVFRQLTQIAATDPAGLFILKSSTSCLEFDISASERRLALETAVSSGEDCLSSTSIASEQAIDMETNADWLNIWSDFQALFFETDSTLYPPQYYEALETVSPETRHKLHPQSVESDSRLSISNGTEHGRLTEPKHIFPAFFSSSEARDIEEEFIDIPILEDETNWELWGDMFDNGELPP